MAVDYFTSRVIPIKINNSLSVTRALSLTCYMKHYHSFGRCKPINKEKPA